MEKSVTKKRGALKQSAAHSGPSASFFSGTDLTRGAPLPMTASVQEILQWLHNREGGQKDHSAIAQYYEYLSGIQIGR